MQDTLHPNPVLISIDAERIEARRGYEINQIPMVAECGIARSVVIPVQKQRQSESGRIYFHGAYIVGDDRTLFVPESATTIPDNLPELVYRNETDTGLRVWRAATDIWRVTGASTLYPALSITPTKDGIYPSFDPGRLYSFQLENRKDQIRLPISYDATEGILFTREGESVGIGFDIDPLLRGIPILPGNAVDIGMDKTRGHCENIGQQMDVHRVNILGENFPPRMFTVIPLDKTLLVYYHGGLPSPVAKRNA